MTAGLADQLQGVEVGCRMKYLNARLCRASPAVAAAAGGCGERQQQTYVRNLHRDNGTCRMTIRARDARA